VRSGDGETGRRGDRFSLSLAASPHRPVSPSLFSPSLFKVRGPRMLYQKPHHKRRRNCVARVVEEPDGKKPEDEGTRRAPEPEILMQDIQSTNNNQQQCSLHSNLVATVSKMPAYYGTALRKIATAQSG
jgi:hypothetical protein